jgi:hypothetical protein
MTMTFTRSRSGFALPVVILAMFLLVGALAAGFAMLRSERASDDGTLQAQAAAALAETGLQQGLTNRVGMGLSSIPGATPDSARLQLAGGYVDVVTTRLRAPVEGGAPGIYYVRTRGVRTATGVSGIGDAVASASAFATYNTITMTVKASMTGINGINKSGSSGLISGRDFCTPAKASLPGVAVPKTPGLTGSGKYLESIDGSQKVDTLAATPVEAADEVPIDWDAIVNHNAISATHEVGNDGTGFPSTTWFTANPTSWPVIIVRNGPANPTNFQLPNQGRGMLIIFGNLSLTGNTAGGDGVLLVGGKISSNCANEINGAVISGLNVKLGYTVENNVVDELSGTKQFKYNSCAVSNALQATGGAGLRAVQSTWSNNFPTY